MGVITRQDIESLMEEQRIISGIERKLTDSERARLKEIRDVLDEHPKLVFWEEFVQKHQDLFTLKEAVDSLAESQKSTSPKMG